MAADACSTCGGSDHREAECTVCSECYGSGLVSGGDCPTCEAEADGAVDVLEASSSTATRAFVVSCVCGCRSSDEGVMVSISAVVSSLHRTRLAVSLGLDVPGYQRGQRLQSMRTRCRRPARPVGTAAASSVVPSGGGGKKQVLATPAPPSPDSAHRPAKKARMESYAQSRWQRNDTWTDEAATFCMQGGRTASRSGLGACALHFSADQVCKSRYGRLVLREDAVGDIDANAIARLLWEDANARTYSFPPTETAVAGGGSLAAEEVASLERVAAFCLDQSRGGADIDDELLDTLNKLSTEFGGQVRDAVATMASESESESSSTPPFAVHLHSKKKHTTVVKVKIR